MATRDQARQEIRSRWREIIPTMTAPAKERVNGETSWICPICSHGTNGDGLTRNPQSKDGNSLKCFSCGFSGDIIDLYQQINHTDFPTAFSFLSEVLNLTIDADTPNHAKNARTERPTSDYLPQGNDTTPPEKESQESPLKRATEGKPNFAPYYTLCRDRLTDPAAVDYLAQRGISLATAQRAGLGYDPAADPMNAPAGEGYKPHPCPRIIIPCTDSFYTARRIDGREEYRVANPKGGKPAPFNLAALYAQEAQEVFIVEGWADALSLMEIGRAAIALNSTNQAGAFIEILREHRPAATLILALDNDEAGRKAAKTIEEGCKTLNLYTTAANIAGEYKDPSEAIVADKEGFYDRVEKAAITAHRPDNTGSYLDSGVFEDQAAFDKPILTGFPVMDTVTGGLYSGLYILAARSALGKTTFALQLADQIAAGGRDVVFFSLEQSRFELVSKSLARTVYLTRSKNMEVWKDTGYSSLDIRKGGLNTGEVRAAIDRYKKEISDRVSIIEGNFETDVLSIRRYLEDYKRRTGAAPVCIIDYVQVLRLDNRQKQMGARETTDEAIREIKRISRDLRIPIIAISSINRSNYQTPISFESLKESGGLEFTADAVWGLQLSILSEEAIFTKDGSEVKKREAVKAALAEDPRRIELVTLKNRFGPSDSRCYFLYWPRYDLFLEDKEYNVRPAEKPFSSFGKSY